MSPDSSANNGPTKDRFAPFRDIEESLCREIALCTDVDKKEQLAWKFTNFYLETARPEKTIPHLQWIVETSPNDESKQDSRRALQFLFGSEEKAIPASHESLDLARALWQMANAFLEKGSQQPSVLCLLRLLDISSDQEQRAECFLLLGAECETADDHDAALRLYQRGIECRPKQIGTRYFLHNNLGFCLNQLGRHDEAETLCRAAIEIDPWRYNAHKNLGLALQGQGMYPEAADLFLKSAVIFPPDPRSLGHLGEILANHREEVEREIPDIDEQIASVIDARQKLMQ